MWRRMPIHTVIANVVVELGPHEFLGRYEPSPLTNPNYAVSPDGQRFLMLKPAEHADDAPTQINIVLNWFEELKRRVPTDKK